MKKNKDVFILKETENMSIEVRGKSLKKELPRKGNIRKLYGATLYYIDRSGLIPVEVYANFEDAKNYLKTECWHLKADIKEGMTFRSAAIIQLWKEGDEQHAITRNGSHYVF